MFSINTRTGPKLLYYKPNCSYLQSFNLRQGMMQWCTVEARPTFISFMMCWKRFPNALHSFSNSGSYGWISMATDDSPLSSGTNTIKSVHRKPHLWLCHCVQPTPTHGKLFRFFSDQLFSVGMSQSERISTTFLIEKHDTMRDMHSFSTVRHSHSNWLHSLGRASSELELILSLSLIPALALKGKKKKDKTWKEKAGGG